MLQLLDELKQHLENGFITEGELWDTLPLEVIEQLKPYIDYSKEYSPIAGDYVISFSEVDWRQQMLDWLLERAFNYFSPLQNKSYWRCSILLQEKYNIHKAVADRVLDWAIHEEKLFPCPGIYGEGREDDLLCTNRKASIFLNRITCLKCYDCLFQEVERDNQISLKRLLRDLDEDYTEIALLSKALDSAVNAGLIKIVGDIITFKS